MLETLKPIRTESLKDVCVAQLEALILSGELPVGHKLPPERDLARQLAVSRPIVHEALVEMAGKGLVSLIPRVGTVVNDYRKEGSIALLTSLLRYNSGKLAPKLLDGLLAMRILFEVENARLAALNRTSAQVDELRAIVRSESQARAEDVETLTSLDFDFHHAVAMATDNLSYPLLLNSFKQIYTRLSGQFFEDPAVVPVVVEGHQALVDAIARQSDIEAGETMRRLLAHGEERLRAIIADPALRSGLHVDTAAGF